MVFPILTHLVYEFEHDMCDSANTGPRHSDIMTRVWVDLFVFLSP